MTEEIKEIRNEQTIEKVDEVKQLLEEVEEPVKDIVEEPVKEIKDDDEVDTSNIVPTETIEMSKEFLKLTCPKWNSKLNLV